jgi:hypothetical protein
MKWSKESKSFVQVESDILEQKHINNLRKESIDYEIFIPCSIKPSDLAVYKIIKTD